MNFKAVRNPFDPDGEWIVIADDPENTVMDQGLTKEEAEETAEYLRKAAMTT